jgi:N-acetylneuraminic acid mutarotase
VTLTATPDASSSFAGWYGSAVELNLWNAASSMSVGRSRHTATLLPGGKVLVAGGTVGTFYLSSAEVYDPAAGAWSGAGNMSIARTAHTATLLPDGTVLIAGGLNGAGTLSSAEIYDPATNIWSSAGSMSSARQSASETLLLNGKVLVAGGTGGAGILSSAEIYDPATDTWSSAGSMLNARSGHTAVLLSNGKVFVAGGSAGGPMTAAEVYDPDTNSWNAATSMGTARAGHSATLLPDGRVLVAGGYYVTLSGRSQTQYAIPLQSAEIYDPATDSWTGASSMSAAHTGHAAMLLRSGKVLVAGGSSSTSAELYDPGTNTWTGTGQMSSARADASATRLLDGRVLMAGGNDGSSDLSSAELWGAVASGVTVAMNGDQSVSAVFVQNAYLITATPNPAAGGVASCQMSAISGMTCTAVASSGFAFVNWTEGGAVISAAPTFTFMPMASRNLVANFVPTATATGTISATPNPCMLTADGTCATTLTWSTSGAASASVYVHAGTSGPLVPMSGGTSGTVVVPWITAAGDTFELHAGPSTSDPLLATVVVSAVVSGNATGILSATPNPCTLTADGTCATTLSWSASGVASASVYVHAGVNGPLVLMSGGTSGTVVVPWITAAGDTFELHAGPSSTDPLLASLIVGAL